MTNTGLDEVSLFGFLSGFFTLVLIGYRQQLRTRLPVITVGMVCCAAYAFLAGAWPAGFEVSEPRRYGDSTLWYGWRS